MIHTDGCHKCNAAWLSLLWLDCTFLLKLTSQQGMILAMLVHTLNVPMFAELLFHMVLLQHFISSLSVMWFGRKITMKAKGEKNDKAVCRPKLGPIQAQDRARLQSYSSAELCSYSKPNQPQFGSKLVLVWPVPKSQSSTIIRISSPNKIQFLSAQSKPKAGSYNSNESRT